MTKNQNKTDSLPVKFYFRRQNHDDVNAYQLENKITDEDFLKGKSVGCNAVIPLSDYLSGILTKGERIVVLLSTGKKFMGEIQNSSFRQRGNLAEGKIEIIRYYKK